MAVSGRNSGSSEKYGIGEVKMFRTKRDYKAGYVVTAFFVICLIAYSALMYQLFYNQAVQSMIKQGGPFESDMKAYLQTILGQPSGYDFPYPIFFWTGRLFLFFTNVNRVEIAGALAAMVLNTLGVIVLAYYMQKSLQDSYGRMPHGDYMGILTVLLSFSIFFVSMLYTPHGIYLPGLTHKYIGVFTPNPYHNATYLATRPFAIAAFFLYARILGYYEERTDWKEFFWFGLFLLLTTMTKPSYTLVLVSTAGLLMVYRLFRKKWKNFRRTFYLGLAFVPTFIDLLYQYGGVFGKSSQAGEAGGIGFGFAAAWGVYMENIPLAIILGLAFPGFFLLFHFKDLKENITYRFSWVQLTVSLLELLVLYEKGKRFIDLNFSWGYMHGQFFVFVTSLILLTRETLEKKQKWYILAAEWLAYAAHLVCGIGYFLFIFRGEGYSYF